MPRPKSDMVQIAIRVPRGWLKRADALAPTIARAGIYISRTDAIRAAIARGLDAFEQEAAAGRAEARTAIDNFRRDVATKKAGKT